MEFVTFITLRGIINWQIFGNYTPWSTHFGVEEAGIDDGIKFLAFHEGLHSGTIMAIKRSVIK